MRSEETFTVVIPTRDRPDTLQYALRTVLCQQDDNLVILVSDNFSSPTTAEVVHAFRDSRIQYVRTPCRLGMADHYEFALRHVPDGWVTIIGDDDGLLPGGLAVVRDVVRQSGCSVLISRLCGYDWPGFNGDADARTELAVPLTTGYEIRDGRRWVERMMLGQTYHNELPTLYTGGFATTATINRARAADGRFYHSMFPDVYSAIALAYTAGAFVALRQPVALSGASRHSIGSAQFGHSAYSEPFNTYCAESGLPCHETLAAGNVVSLGLVYYESYLQSAHLHQDFLNLRLTDQLELAIVDATQRSEEHGYLMAVAERNGLDYAAVSRRARRGLGRRLRQYRRDREARRDRLLVPGACGATNILEAAWVCNGILGARRPTRRASGSVRDASPRAATHASNTVPG